MGPFLGIRIGGRRGGGAAAPDGNPSDLVATVISDVRIDLSWTNGATNQDGTEVFISTDGSTYTSKGTTEDNGTTFSATSLSADVLYYFKVAHYRGAIYSEYSNVVSIIAPLTTETDFWYKPYSSDAVVKDINGVESIYWDMMKGSVLRGAEISSGNIVRHVVYEITACQANFFYTGCAIGDVFPCDVVKTCDANNKVKRVTGNHLTQPTVAKRPTNRVFNGTSSFMQTPTFTFAQPEEIFMLFRLRNWVVNRGIMDGFTANSGLLYTQTSEPTFKAYGGSAFSAAITEARTAKWVILRVLFNGANSEVQIDNNATVTGSFGTTAMAGLTIGALPDGSGWSNIEVKEIIGRKSVSSESEKTNLYNYLLSKKPVDNSIENSLSKSALILSFDDYPNGANGFHTNAFPMMEAKGVKGNAFVWTDQITSLSAWEEMLELQQAGWEICNHTKTHSDLTTLTAGQIVTEITDSQNAFIANGLTKPLNFGYPIGNYALAGDKLAVIQGEFNSARRYNDNSLIYSNTDIWNIPSYELANSGYSLTKFQLLIEKAFNSKTAIGITTHYVYPEGTIGGAGIDVDRLEDIIDYALSLGMDVITLQELHELMT
jgi:peptidoglycan/xylan/chitin deacetylase (PgdA/CDA1 family)